MLGLSRMREQIDFGTGNILVTLKMIMDYHQRNKILVGPFGFKESLEPNSFILFPIFSFPFFCFNTAITPFSAIFVNLLLNLS